LSFKVPKALFAMSLPIIIEYLDELGPNASNALSKVIKSRDLARKSELLEERLYRGY
jgi:hypothetical protein